MTYSKAIIKILIGIFIFSFLVSAQTKYRKALLLNQSVGGQIYNNINVNCGTSSVTAKTEAVAYNRANGLSGSDSISINNQYYPSGGNNSYNSWHYIFDKQYATDWNNLSIYRNIYSVIMIKACFAYEGSHSAEGSADDIPYRNSRRTTWLTKWHVRAMVDSMKKMPTTFWVIWTQIPISQNDNTTYAQRDKRIAQWMKDTLAVGLDPVYGNNFPSNVYIFDVHSLMSDANGKMLYGCSNLDPHPTPTGIATASPPLINEIFHNAIAYEGGIEAPAAPQLKSPGNGSTGQTNYMILHWYRSLSATSYHLQVSLDSLFGSLVIDDSTLTDTLKNIEPLANLTTYYWRIKAKNLAGYSGWSNQWKFTTANELTAPAIPVLYSPVDGSVDQPNYTIFNWHTSVSAASYYLQVSPDSLFGTLVVNDSTLTDTLRDIGPLANNTTYYWRVKAKNTEGYSGWSSQWKFTTAGELTAPAIPVLYSPANSSTGHPDYVLIRWRTSVSAASYYLQVSPDSLFGTLVVNDSTLTDTLKNIGPLTKLTKYYWRVRAKNAAGYSGWSAQWNFTTASGDQVPAIPVLNIPVNGSTGHPENIYLRWYSNASAASYYLQVSIDPLFGTLVVNDSTLTYAYRGIGPLVNNTTYYWRVKAKNTGGYSGWSSQWKFTTAGELAAPAIPVLYSPANSSTDQSDYVLIRWRTSVSAASYYLQVSPDSLFGTLVVNDSTLTDTLRDIGPLVNNTTYYWRVQAKNAAGYSGWSSQWKFTTASEIQVPASPVLYSPVNGSTGHPENIYLRWYSSASANSYYLQVSLDSLFGTLIVNDSTLTYAYRGIGPLANLTTYYWRVKAKNTAGYSNWSAQWKFTTTGESQAPAIPVLNLPVNGSTGYPEYIYLRWYSSASASSYYLQVSLDSLFGTLIVNDSTLTYAYRGIGPLANNTTYYWCVKAKNTGGYSGWSSQWKFTTASENQVTAISAQTYVYSYNAGWNIVSVPLSVKDYRIDQLYPTAISNAYEYQSSYIARDTLSKGLGYWIKFQNIDSTTISGNRSEVVSVQIMPGWNIIGSISKPIHASNIFSDPPGIITSQFFGYNNGYYVSDSIIPGKAYWVKADDAGFLILNGDTDSSMNMSRIVIQQTNELPPDPPEVKVIQSSLPETYILNQAYPNPFNPNTTIRYQLPENSKVSLKVYNSLGQVVIVITDDVEDAGFKSVNWNALNLASGIYFYCLEATSVSDPSKTFTQVKKMLLMK